MVRIPIVHYTYKRLNNEEGVDMTRNVRRGGQRRLPYEVIEPLYAGGYSTQDIASIIGTSSGSVSRGLKNRVDRGTSYIVKELRPRGKKTNRLAPIEIARKVPNFTESMKEYGYNARFKKYYNEVSMIQKASFIKDMKAVHPDKSYEEIGQLFGISRSSITRLNKRVNEGWLLGRGEILDKIEAEEGLSERLKVEAQLLRQIYQRARTAFTFDSKRDRQYEEIQVTEFEV